VPQKFADFITIKMTLKAGKYNKKCQCINTMAAALFYTDQAITVSPNNAVELATDEEKDCDLEALFGKAKVTGILNGVKEGRIPD
jgi:glycogen synthase